MLVAQEGKADQRAFLQGEPGLEGSDQGAMGEAPGKRGDRRHEFHGRWKSKKGFGYQVRSSVTRSSNTPVWELLADERFTEAVLEFIRNTRVGRVKAGVVIDRIGT